MTCPSKGRAEVLARAFLWNRVLDSGEITTIAELAEREGIATSYMTRILRLTQLSPDIVEAILVGSGHSRLTIARLLEPFPTCWEDQAATISDQWSAIPNRADVNLAGPSKVTRAGRYRDCDS